MAPEIHLERPYNGDSADLFALGVIIFVLVIGRFPFFKATQEDLRFLSISKGPGRLFWRGLPDSLSLEFKSLITAMFQ